MPEIDLTYILTQQTRVRDEMAMMREELRQMRRRADLADDRLADLAASLDRLGNQMAIGFGALTAQIAELRAFVEEHK